MQYAIVDSTGKVLNVVIWDGETTYPLSSGQTLVESDNDNCHIGGTYIDGTFSAPADFISNGSLVNPVPASDS